MPGQPGCQRGAGMAQCKFQCKPCRMMVTVLVQGDAENPVLAAITEEILRDTKSCGDVSTILRLAGIDAVVECPHRNKKTEEEDCLF